IFTIRIFTLKRVPIGPVIKHIGQDEPAGPIRGIRISAFIELNWASTGEQSDPGRKREASGRIGCIGHEWPGDQKRTYNKQPAHSNDHFADKYAFNRPCDSSSANFSMA